MFVKEVTISRINGDVVILIFSRKWLSVNKATFCIYFSSKRCKVETWNRVVIRVDLNQLFNVLGIFPDLSYFA